MKKSDPLIPVKVLYWSSQISTMSFELALCIGIGFWADENRGTTPLYILLGCLMGFTISAWHLYQLVRSMNESDKAK